MFEYSTSLRVHYALTDQMGVVYHGNYAQFYEIGRTEALRSLGFTYKGLEEMGIIMPVVDMKIKFLRPVLYDDLITVHISVKELPHDHKIVFHGEIFNEKNELTNVSDITLYFMEASSNKKVSIPEKILAKMKLHYE